MPITSVLGGTVLHGGTPGDYDPQAAITGGMVGIAAFFIFVLGMTVWSLLNRYWLGPRGSRVAEVSSGEPTGETNDDAALSGEDDRSNVVFIDVPRDKGPPYPPIDAPEEGQEGIEARSEPRETG
jgi:hypothetical protein